MAYNSYHDPAGSYDQSTPPPGDDRFVDERSYPGSSSFHTPYPSQYMSDQVQMPQPRMPSPSFQSQPPLSAGNPAGGRIDDAVASAVNQADASNHFSPDLISQVTATVIQQLQAYGLGSPQQQQQQQQQQQPPPPPPAQSAPPVPDTTYYEPPPAPRYRANESLEAREPKDTYSIPIETRDGSRRPSPGKVSDAGSESRPPMSERIPTSSGEMTTLEKIWGKMFEDGKPTPRLGQLLRGIAVHLIEDHHPGNTIVVIPEKMQKYYSVTKVSTDTYPWHDIFDDQASSISRIYRDVEAEHHLVQDPANLNTRPDKPGLTPRGFERWFTLMIQSNPDREFARLQKTVLDMPISNPDDKKERFPKELPRRLFPSSADLNVLEKLEASIVTHSGLDLPRNLPQERAKSPARRAPVEKSPSRAATEQAPHSIQEREPKAYSSTPSSAVVEDEEDETIPPRPIERERKPYSAQPGGGKVYGDVNEQNPKTETNKAKEFVSSPTTTSSHRQSHSYSQEPPHVRPTQGTGPTSGYNGHTHHSSISSKPGRARSSSVGFNGGPGDYRHSEPDLNSFDADYGNSYKISSATGDGYDDGRRHRDYDRDDSRDYEVLRERERDRERRYHDHLGSRNTWSDEDYYRGLLGGQGGGPVGGTDYRHR